MSLTCCTATCYPHYMNLKSAIPTVSASGLCQYMWCNLPDVRLYRDVISLVYVMSRTCCTATCCSFGKGFMRGMLLSGPCPVYSPRPQVRTWGGDNIRECDSRMCRWYAIQTYTMIPIITHTCLVITVVWCDMWCSTLTVTTGENLERR